MAGIVSAIVLITHRPNQSSIQNELQLKRSWPRISVLAIENASLQQKHYVPILTRLNLERRIPKIMGTSSSGHIVIRITLHRRKLCHSSVYRYVTRKGHN